MQYIEYIKCCYWFVKEKQNKNENKVDWLILHSLVWDTLFTRESFSFVRNFRSVFTSIGRKWKKKLGETTRSWSHWEHPVSFNSVNSVSALFIFSETDYSVLHQNDNFYIINHFVCHFKFKSYIIIKKSDALSTHISMTVDMIPEQ